MNKDDEKLSDEVLEADQTNPDEGSEAVEVGQSSDKQATEESQVELMALLEDARAKADDHWDRLVRVQAELENLRRRATRDVENAHKYALERFAQDLLPVKDSLELGITAAGADGANIQKLVEGSQLTLKQLQDCLEKFGVKEVNPQDQPFDPELHQAMTMQEVAGKAPNTVVTVFQKGYLLNDRLIRPALVVVSKEPAETTKTEKTDADEPSVGGNIDEQA